MQYRKEGKHSDATVMIMIAAVVDLLVAKLIFLYWWLW